MSESNSIKIPAGYVTASAIGFADGAGMLAVASETTPLPTTIASPAAPDALSGSANSNRIAGPFVPVVGRPVMVQLTGDWIGSVQMRRSVDGGTTKLPITLAGGEWGRFTGNACEPVWDESEAGAQLYLDIAIYAGTVAYRVSQ